MTKRKKKKNLKDRLYSLYVDAKESGNTLFIAPQFTCNGLDNMAFVFSYGSLSQPQIENLHQAYFANCAALAVDIHAEIEKVTSLTSGLTIKVVVGDGVNADESLLSIEQI